MARAVLVASRRVGQTNRLDTLLRADAATQPAKFGPAINA